MSVNDEAGAESPAEILATLRASGWSQDDLEAVPLLSALLDEERRK
jgi:hypothetical protein